MQIAWVNRQWKREFLKRGLAVKGLIRCSIGGKKCALKGGFLLSVWQREREREQENYHVGMRSLIFLLYYMNNFLSICSLEKVELSLTYSSTLSGEPNDNQSNRLIFASAAFLLFLNRQSNTTLIALLCSCARLCFRSRSQTDNWKSTL